MSLAPLLVLVDDNPGDIELVKIAFQDRGVPARFQVISSGVEAFHRFRQLAQEPNQGIPDLLVLDLNMPAFNGLQLLAYIRTQQALRNLKVAVLSSTSRAHDQARARALGAGVYLVKPMVLEEYGELINQLQAYLKTDCTCPPP